MDRIAGLHLFIRIVGTGGFSKASADLGITQPTATRHVAALLPSRVGGQLRVSTSVAFGRRVVTPPALRFMREHPDVGIDLSFDDRCVDLVGQGVAVALRIGRPTEWRRQAH